MTPREAEIEAEARIALRALRDGQGDDQHLASALHALGNARLVEAQTDVERYMTHLAPHIRHLALHVLAFHLIDQTHYGIRKRKPRKWATSY